MVGKSSTDDAAVAADVVVAHMTELLVVASADTVAGALRSTFDLAVVAAKRARHTCGVDRVWMEMLPMLENSIGECGMRSAGKGASSARLP